MLEIKKHYTVLFFYGKLFSSFSFFNSGFKLLFFMPSGQIYKFLQRMLMKNCNQNQQYYFNGLGSE